MAAADGAVRPGREFSPIAAILKPVRVPLGVAALMSAVGAAFSLVPLAGLVEIARIVFEAHGAAPSALPAAVWPLAWTSMACLLIGMALVSSGELLAHLVDNRLTDGLRVAASRRLAQVPLGWFTSRASGEVKQAMQDDIGTLHELSAHGCTTLGRAIGAVVASVVYLFAIDWRMAVVSLLPFPVFFLFFGRAVKRSAANMGALVHNMGSINNAVVEFLGGIAAVKAFGSQGRAHRAYRQAVDGFADAFVDFTRPLVGAMANANAMIAPTAVLGVVLLAGTAFVGLGWIAPLDVLPFALVAPGISAPLMLLHYHTHDLNAATGAALRLRALLQTPVLQVPATDQAQCPADAGIRFERVGYAYDKGHPILSDVSFVLRPGTVTAIVGSSGSGKSTLARLLLRFFDPSEGRIIFGGVDLRRIEPAELYRRIGFVLQEVRLLHATVRDNIALGRPDAGPAAVEEAARAANIHDRILRLPRGYDSVVGEDARLSGGEQQRIGIARALLLDAPVLVLDEPTAAADAENETAIQSALSRIAAGRTLLVIAHRLDTVMHADRIVVMEGGTVAEQGSHAELLARRGRYARLWQVGGYELAAQLRHEGAS